MSCEKLKSRLSLKLGSKKLFQTRLMRPSEAQKRHSDADSMSGGANAVPFTGLRNMGNTCYVNSILQALRFCPGFLEGVSALQQLVGDSRGKVSGGTAPPTAPGEMVSGSSEPLLISHLNLLLQEMALMERTQTPCEGVEPTSFIAKLKEDCPAFAGSMQQDAQEMLKFLLSNLQDAALAIPMPLTPCKAEEEREEVTADAHTFENCHEQTSVVIGRKRKTANSQCGTVAKVLKPLSGNRHSPCNGLYSPQTPTDNSATPEKIMNGNSDFVTDMFQGTLTFQTRCFECDSCSQRPEDFLDITVPVSSAGLPGFPPTALQDVGSQTTVGPCSLSWALSQFASRERLQGDNKYWCDQCSHFVEAERSILLSRLPVVLTIHLNRFSAQLWGNSAVMVTKVGGNLATPLTLSLRPWCTASCTQRERMYKLFAVVFHSGSTCSSGHYVTCARTAESRVKGQEEDTWVYFDDEHLEWLTQTDLVEMLSPLNTTNCTAYILFYGIQN